MRASRDSPGGASPAFLLCVTVCETRVAISFIRSFIHSSFFFGLSFCWLFTSAGDFPCARDMETR